MRKLDRVLNSRPRFTMHDGDAQSAPRYEGIGTSLRAIRVRYKLTLADVSAQLRIRQQYLEAIEEGRFDALPGHIYAIGFLRTYADALGLDGEAAVAAFKQEAVDAQQDNRLVFRMPKPESRTPKLWLVAAGLVGAALIYAAWISEERGERVAIETVEPVPQRLAAQLPQPQSVAIPAPAADPPPTLAQPLPARGIDGPQPDAVEEADSQTSASPVAAVRPASVSQAASAQTATNVPPPPAAPVSQTAALSGGESHMPTIYGEENRNARIVILATGESWVQVQGPGNEILLTRILRPGDSYRAPNRPELTLMTGNAGALQITVDGRAVPSIGPFGAVRRNVVLEPERLLSGAAVPN